MTLGRRYLEAARTYALFAEIAEQSAARRRLEGHFAAACRAEHAAEGLRAREALLRQGADAAEASDPGAPD